MSPAPAYPICRVYLHHVSSPTRFLDYVHLCLISFLLSAFRPLPFSIVTVFHSLHLVALEPVLHFDSAWTEGFHWHYIQTSTSSLDTWCIQSPSVIEYTGTGSSVFHFA
jgi:hypothetical protein